MARVFKDPYTIENLDKCNTYHPNNCFATSQNRLVKRAAWGAGLAGIFLLGMIS